MDPWALGKDPIFEDHPAGNDVRYESVFEDLQAEVDKLSLPSAASTGIDWKKVADMSAKILSQHAKDILVVSYFSVAQTHLDQIEGLYKGIRVYCDLLENYWDTLFPAKKRMRGRLGALEWWIEKSETAILANKVAISSSQQTALKNSLGKLTHLIDTCFPDPPSLRPLTSALEPLFNNTSIETNAVEQAVQKQKQGLEKTAPEQAPPIVHEQNNLSQPTTTSSITETPLPEKESDNTVQKGMETIRRAASNLEKSNPADPQVFRLRRLALWASIENPPPASQGQTLIPPPDPQMSTMLKNLHEKGDWINLFSASETQLTQNIFWLDLNRYTADSLENSGIPFKAAHEAVCQETIHLIQRMPDLPTYSFSDGSSLANQQTQDWIVSISPQNDSALNVSIYSGEDASKEQNKFDIVFQKAKKLSKDKKLIEAVILIQHELSISPSDKDRMLWRLALSRILLAARKADMAKPHFDKILEDIERYNIEKWDPILALQCFKVILTGFKAISGKTAKQEAGDILARISRISPTDGLRLG